ncbi:DUF4317 family protein [Viridibacillus arvi]|uniref:DUF4317 family protein n=1 Tax=Viridibacillus arvi TaxID=263475 RepID=UPI0034CDA1E7
MNKKDIASVRKEFKSESFKLRIKDIFTVYVQKEKSEIFHKEYNYFSMLEAEQQVLYLQNFKKVLSGNLAEKLFEVKFNKSIKNNAQDILFEGVKCDSDRFQELMLELVKRNIDEDQYNEDMIFTFIRAEYYMAVNKKKKGKDKEEEKSAKENFIFFSLNKTTSPKKALLFDYTRKEFKSNLVLDAMINLTTPIQGFMFPTIQQGATVDINRVLYSTGKKNLPDRYFISKVLNGDTEIETADNETIYFNEILIKALGGKTNPKVISNVFYRLNRIVESEKEEESRDDEPVMLDYKDITNILISSGVTVESEDIKEIFKEVVADEKYEFKAENLLSQNRIDINSRPVKLSVDAQDLQKVRQILHNGKLCLMIEIDQNIEVNGLTIETEVEE